MAASVAALATVIWSDLADAAEPAKIELADDLVAPQPVKLAKVEHKQTLDQAIFEPAMEPSKASKPKRKSRINFGSFEGY